jgi:hypothetical protein
MDQVNPQKKTTMKASTLAEIQTASSLTQVGRNAIFTYRFCKLARYVTTYIYRMAGELP